MAPSHTFSTKATSSSSNLFTCAEEALESSRKTCQNSQKVHLTVLDADMERMKREVIQKLPAKMFFHVFLRVGKWARKHWLLAPSSDNL